VADRIGPANLDAMAEELGLPASELRDDLSEVLGTDAVSPLQMATVYATFADGGVYHTPLLVTRVTTASGAPLPLPVAPASHQVLTPAQDGELTYVLQQVVLRGTGTAAGGIGSPVAGKTGTTDNSTDAWFIGYTPNLTTAVWMGYASGSRPMNDYHWDGEVLSSVQGGTVPAAIWHDYMAAALSSEPQWAGRFPAVSYLAGAPLSPPPAGSVLFPEGLGTTTTTAPVTTTTRPSPTTTTPTTTTQATTSPPATAPATVATSPATTAPGTSPTAPASTTATRPGG
jgi:membrane peptidoglycan carboxypeptidase